MGNKLNKDITVESIVDTTEIKVGFSNMNTLILDDSLKENKCVKKEKDNIKKQVKTIVINLHMLNGTYIPIKSLKEYKETMKGLLKDRMEVIDHKKVKMNRVDIAVDIDWDFKKNYKFLLFFFALYTENLANSEGDKRILGDMWETTNLKSLRNNSIKWSNSHYEVSFYDKKEESKGMHEFSTRLEFRYKKLSEYNFEKNINKILATLKDVEKNIEHIEEMFAESLVELYRECEDNGEATSYTGFVRAYNKYFFTSRVVELVYKEIGLKGNFKNWMKLFKKKNGKLNFYKKSDVKAFKTTISNSLKELKKS